MKKVSILLLGILALFASCDKVKNTMQQASARVTEMENSEEAEQQLTKVSYCSPDSMVQLSAEIPVYADNDLLNDSILAYIDKNFRGFAEAYAVNHDAQGSFKSGGEALWAQLQSEIADLKAEFEEGDEIPDYVTNWSYEDAIELEDATDNYVTFVSHGYEYQGGAHGISWVVGATLNKQTGRTIGQEILKDTDSAGFQTLLKKGLEEYFGDVCDDMNTSLSDWLFINPDEETIPIPNMRIYKGTFIFQYQSYEIAPYAYGMPAVILTFDQIKPYLTSEGLRLIGE